MVPPKFPAVTAGHFALTSISLPCNAGIAVRTTCRTKLILSYVHLYDSGGNFDWFRTNAAFSTWSGRISLAASASLLSSVTAFIWGRLLLFIICENGWMSRLWDWRRAQETGCGVGGCVSSGFRYSAGGESARSGPGSRRRSPPLEVCPSGQARSLP